MAYLQFMNGSRDQQVEELNPAASLVVGSAEDAHVRVADAGVESRHCQVYPAQGSFWLQDLGAGNTILHMKRLKGTTEGLKAGDIFILGQTFVKFWTEKPTVGAAPAPAAAGGGPALDALKRELSAAQAEAARSKADAEKARAEGESARADVEKVRGEGEQAKRELEAALDEATRARADVERERTAKEQVERQREEADEQRQKGEKQRQELEEARETLDRRVRQLEAELETTRSDATAEVAKARAEADAELARAREALEREQTELRSSLEASLEATRAECAALRARDEARGRDRLAALAEPNDLSKVIEALALPDALRVRLEAAVEDAVSREALRRVNGPVVPLRGLRVPGCERDLEGELGAVRRRQEQVEAARGLALHELEASQLDRLLEAARS